MDERRPQVTDPATLAVLAHPVRLDLLNHLMASGPATASSCARAVGDNPSNCSYHLRMLAKCGLVEPVESGNGRERPWRATITGFSVENADARGAQPVVAAAIQLDQRHARGYLARRRGLPREWQAADAFSSYGLRMTAAELADLVSAVDGLIRPYIAATRTDTPQDAGLVHFGVQGFLQP